MKLWTIFVLVLALSVPSLAADKKGKVEDQIKKMEHDRAQAAMKADAETLGSSMTDDYMMITPSGTVEDKTTVLNSFKSGDRKIESVELDDSDMKVRVYGNTAVVTGSSTVKATNKGEDMSGKYRYTRVYVKQGGKWKTAAFQQTKVQ
jgi:uncharacterized protein (TIGR02246 family)